MTTFSSAAAAEAAGYRACLQCRPYRLPPPAPWTGAELVCRAVQVILDGGLDGSSEAELGRRLAVSPRHLRRLFTAHLGVTPDGLARSARAHFARRLLDDTDLTVLQVALAAGFGSVRQLNRVCRDVFHASPTELRRRRRKADRLVADGGLLLRLPVQGPLAWQPMLDHFAVRAIPGVEHVDSGTYRRTIRVDGAPAMLEFSYGGDGHVLLLAHLPHWDGLIHLVARARRIFSLDLDPTEARHHLRADTILGPLLSEWPGVRPPGAWDPYEVGVRAIIGRQRSAESANAICGTLVARHGTPVEGLEPIGLTHQFPSASTLAEARLADLGLTDSCQETIRAFAHGVSRDEIRLDRSVCLDELISSLVAIPGIGQWTANYVALRLGEPDASPLSDFEVLNALPAQSRARHERIQLAHERWRPWRAVVAAYVWALGSPADLAAAG